VSLSLTLRVRYGSVLSVFHLRRLLGSCLVPGALLAQSVLSVISVAKGVFVSSGRFIVLVRKSYRQYLEEFLSS
jgi:hypothetical protein